MTWVFLPAAGVHASLDVIYKEPKGMKSLQPGKTVTAPKEGLKPGEKRQEKHYSYNPIGKTDPFKPFIVEKEAVKEKKDTRPKTYLETLDLSQLDLIAVILSPAGNWAMVRDAKGLGYTVKKGTPIGKKDGVIYEIRDDSIVVREKERDFRGRTKSKDVVKKILQVQ
jgi:type IV pilus assembly protein PilP